MVDDRQMGLGIGEAHTLPSDAITSFRGPYRWLSNFYACTISYDGLDYPSVEHAYQAAKTLDPAERQRIALLATPGETKRAGKQLKLRSDWARIKIDVMRELISLKFPQSPFQEKLLATGDRMLIEGNAWNDRFWGQCPVGVGRNELGKLIMEARAHLRCTPTNTTRRDSRGFPTSLVKHRPEQPVRTEDGPDHDPCPF